MTHPDESNGHPPSDPDSALSSITTDTCKREDGKNTIELTPHASHPDANATDQTLPTPALNGDGLKDRSSDESTASRSPHARRRNGPTSTMPTRAMKKGLRGHSTRSHGGRRAMTKPAHVCSTRPPPLESSSPGKRAASVNEVSKETQETKSPESLPSSPPLEARRSTYFSICLNASPDELTVVSYNLRMEPSCLSFDDNWRRREAALYRYLLTLEDAHHPDVLLVQGAYSRSTQRLLRRLIREEPMFPFQTRVVGGDAGTCNADHAEGGCSCCSSWCCIPFPSHKAAKKPAKKDGVASFVTNNGWDSVCGNFSRFRGNGGIVVMSKWPILRRHAYIFSTSAYPQSLSNAGAALVQVEKCGKVYNVLAMQLQPGANHNALRIAQVKEVMAWARTGVEDAEKVEFASCDVDGAFNSPADVSTGSKRTDTATDLPRESERPSNGGLPALHSNESGSSANRIQDLTNRSGSATLPKGILKATDPLIIGGNLNFRFSKDGIFLEEALGADGFSATLALEDASVAQPSFDTVNNDTCYQSQGCPEQPTQELLDYLLIYSDHAGRVARGQRTLVDPAPDKILYRPVMLGCMPCNAAEVSHVSDFFPVCATFAHTMGT